MERTESASSFVKNQINWMLSESQEWSGRILVDAPLTLGDSSDFFFSGKIYGAVNDRSEIIETAQSSPVPLVTQCGLRIFGLISPDE